MEWVLDRNEVFMAHILAIDDDPGILALIEHALRREGHTITCMPHVPADLAAHLAEYDLILLDVMMPQTDGYELCSAIRDDTDCPILFLTAKTMEEDVDYGFPSVRTTISKSPSPSLNCVRALPHICAGSSAKNTTVSPYRASAFCSPPARSQQAVSRSPLPGRSMRSHFCSQKTAGRHFPGSRSTKRS